MDWTPEALAREIAAGEGKSLEFKRGLPRDAKTARSLCAFANTRGGLLLIGVGDRGERIGAPHPRETMERLRAIAATRLDPPLTVQVGTLRLDGVALVWCSVPISPARPHRVLDDKGEGEFVVRVGASNRKASGPTLVAIKAQRASGDEIDDLQRRVLAWVGQRPVGANSDATVAAFARENNIGIQRARRAFTRLELAGRLVGHGPGASRAYALP